MMRQRTIAFLAGFALLGLVSCGPPAGQEKTESGEKIVTITLNNGPLEEDIEQKEENAAKNAPFLAERPNIRVIESPWQYTPESFLTRMAGGTCTDVIGIPQATELKHVVDKGLALDLTPFIEKWEGRHYLNPVVMQNYTVRGRIYALPGGPGYSTALAFHKGIFREAGLVDTEGNYLYPKTWEELAETATRLTDKSKGRVGYVLLGGDAVASWHFLNWAYQAGGDFEREVDGKWKAVFNEPPVVQALQFIKDLRWKFGCVQEDLFINNDALLEMLASGRAAMATFTPEYLRALERRYGMKVDDLGIAPLPAGPSGYACVMGGGFGIINPTIPKERQQAAFDFLAYSLTPQAHEEAYKVRQRQGRVIGYPGVAHLTGQWQEQWEAMEAKYRTLPYYGDYRENVANHARFEPPYFTQQLYDQILLPILQETLTKADSDPQALLNDGVKKFQTQFLDRAGI